MSNRFFDDFRQTGTVMTQEFNKCIKSKKLLAFILVIVAITSIITLSFIIANIEFPDDSLQFISLFIGFSSIIAVIAVTLFSAGLIVSEYEERTGLLLFTRPIKKGSIFAGKFLAGFIIATLMMIIYYLIVAALSYVITGSIDDQLWESLGLMIVYIFGISGIAIFFSSLFKKSSVSTLMTVLILILIGPMISTMMSQFNVEPWFSISYSSGTIVNILTEVTTGIQYQIQDGVVRVMNGYVPDVTLSYLVMAAWGVFSTLFALMLFKRRSF